MNHLSTDELIEFVSSSKLDDETLTLMATVNQHIRKCSKCLHLVQAFQLVYDEFVEMSTMDDFKSYFYNVSGKEKYEIFSELEETERELDGIR